MFLSIRRPNGLKEYLEVTGVLKKGNKEAIEAAKQVYRAKYQKEYKRNRRAKFPEVTVVMDRQTYKQLSKNAKEHNLSLASFLREATIHYSKQKYLVPDPGIIAKFAQKLRLCASDINLMAKHVKNLHHFELYEAYASLSERIQYLEKYVADTLCNPPRA